MTTFTIKGNVKLTSTDANTGEILQVDEGENLVLNTGLVSLCHLLGGDIRVPEGSSPGSLLSASTYPILYLPQYGQFGMSAATPRADDLPRFANGTLASAVVNPIDASDIIKADVSYPSTNSVKFQFLLKPNQGNSQAGGNNTYSEVVLMALINRAPVTYQWFARRVFSQMIKRPSTILSAEWTFTFATAPSV